MRQAVILCGGKGTRLGDLTDTTPKPLLEVGDMPFIEHLIQEVSRYGFEEIVLLTGYLSNQFLPYDGGSFNQAKLRVIQETQPLGTWGSVLNAEHALDDYFLLLNGDSWLDYDLTHLRKLEPKSIHMIGRYIDNADRYETLNIENNKVKKIVERGEATAGYINSGIYVVNTSIIENSDWEGEVSLERDILPELSANGTLTAETCQGDTFFIDIGVPDDYERAQTEMIAQRTRPVLFLDRDNTLTYDREGYTHHPDDMEFMPGAIELIQRANHLGYYVFVVTNQGGVTKGKYEEHYILDFYRKMLYTLMEYDAHIDGIDYEIELDSYYRKPEPGMLQQFMSDWPVDRSNSIMIGDKDTDYEAGINAGISSYKTDGSNLLTQFGELIKYVRK